MSPFLGTFAGQLCSWAGFGGILE